MAIRPLANGIQLSATPNTVANASYVYMPTATLSLVSITDVSNNVLASIYVPLSSYSNPVIISKKPYEYLTSSVAFTCFPVSIEGTERIITLKPLANAETVNSTSFSTISNATAFAVTAISNTLVLFLDASNTQYASVSLAPTNIMVFSKDPTDIISSNTFAYVTKVAKNY